MLVAGARLTVLRAMLERFPLGSERDAWLAWLSALGDEPEHQRNPVPNAAPVRH
jgi:hypothetical protein